MPSPVEIMIQNRHLQTEAAFAAYGQSLKAIKEAPKDADAAAPADLGFL